MTATIRVVVADDHPGIREGLRVLLEPESDIALVGEAGSATEAVDLAATLEPDVLILDIELPDLSAEEVLRQVQAAAASTRVLALNSYNNEKRIVDLLASGMAGYVTKGEAPDVILRAIRAVAHGESDWLSTRVAANVAGTSQRYNLTDQELNILRHIVFGHTNSEIAAALGISAAAVEQHLAAIYTKLDVATRGEAAVAAVEAGLV